ncbi:MAG: hypothetical protein AAGJ73_04100 [Pseudomonadota bacterium]
MRLLSLVLAMVLASAAIFTAHAREEIYPDDAHIEIAQLRNGEWRVAYNLSRPVNYLDLGPSLNGFRQTDWRVVGDGVRLTQRGDRDYLEARRGRFDTVAVRIKGRTLGFVKHYEPIRPFGRDGALVYTGHFWPWRNNGGRIKAAFDFNPLPGARVAVFDDQKKRIERWRGVFSHPAFVYFGPIKANETKKLVWIADPAAPRWVEKEFQSSAPKIFDFLENAFRSELEVKPNVFLSFEEGGPETLLRYSGDALPGQFQLSLYGGGWRRRSSTGEDLIRRAIAHEAVHLWQSAVKPFHEDVPAWIHEGAADAIAAEAMRATGYWTVRDVRRDFDRARSECADQLYTGSLAAAEARGAVRALYACGYVLMRAAADTHNGSGSVTAFWRAFAARAEDEGGYDAALLYKSIAEAGGRDGADAIRRFATTPLANPEKEINRLLSNSRSTRAP